MCRNSFIAYRRINPINLMKILEQEVFKDNYFKHK